MIRDGVIETAAVAEVMRRLDRRHFARSVFEPGALRPKTEAYRDAPLPISAAATISAPHMHARALELLAPVLKGKADAKALDVGCGTGYLTVGLALLGHEALGIENIQDLTDLSSFNFKHLEPSLKKEVENRVKFKTADGWKGVPEAAPFDAIHVGAAARTIPDALVHQLKRGGRMIIPVGAPNAPQYFVQVDKSLLDDTVQVTKLFGVRYVELVDKDNPGYSDDDPFIIKESRPFF